MAKKSKYRVRNWSEYNKALVNRGSLTVWFDKESITSWFNQSKSGKKGRSQTYSDLAIQCCLTLKLLFKLRLRATQGFVDSLLLLMRQSPKAPDYSSLSRRQNALQLMLP